MSAHVKTPERTKDAGIAYITVLFVLVVTCALAMCFLHRASVGTAATASRTAAMQAEYLAESAANHALWRLLNEEAFFPASPDVYYMHSLAGGRYGYKVRRHTPTTFATVAVVGAFGDQVTHQSYVIHIRADALSRGLVAHWKMNEAGGLTAYDYTGYGRNGTLTNMDPATDWVPGRIGNGLDFDGVNDYVSVAHHNTLSITGKITIAAWVNNSSLSGSDAIIAKPSFLGDEVNYWFGTDGDEILFRFAEDWNWYSARSSGANLQPGTWVHMAVTFDEETNQLKFYRNGIHISSGTIWFDISRTTNTAPVNIGRSITGLHWHGKIDDLRLYNRILSSAEVLSIFQEAGP